MKQALIRTLYVLIILLIIYFIIGYINFKNITNNKKPLFIINEKSYSINKTDTVTIYDNLIYKIVAYENKDVKITYNMKLWFEDDVK